MKIRYIVLVLLIFMLSKQDGYGQFGFSHELGVITGPVVFYSDFGQRNDTETNLGNVGVGIGLIHYLNFSYRADCNCYTKDTYFNDHFKLRNEISYHKTNLEHLGKWVDPSRTSLIADQLRAMKGSTSVFDIGSQLEFFPLSIRDFAAGSYKIAPFISLGVHWVNFDPEVYSELGPLGTPITTPDKYFDAYTNSPGTTWSVVWSAGIRYKLTPLSDLMLDSRWQHYFSNWVEGLNPDVPENKANDWIFWLNVGYIYYLD
ncbi:MAG: glutamate dehydrogenase [Flavobacteriaceae bacterium CG2_30_34_30]|nr:MAG: glutamate dehydrogenase [Flavobacteriaceae bacterium CG2_30_34_30]